MRRILLPALIFIAALHGFGEARLYKSNDAGMLLQPIAPYLRDQFDWIMQITEENGIETRRLFEKGRETRRWEVAWAKGGSQRVEKEWRDDLLAARRIYDVEDTLLQEELYEAEVISQKILFSYAGGRLTRKRVLDADGSPLYTEEYLYAANGSLREVRRAGQAGDMQLSAYNKSVSGLAEERVSLADTLSIKRYDARTRLVSRELRSGGTTVLREDFTFRPDSDLLLSSREEHPGDGTVIECGYDEQGRLASETTTQSGMSPQIILYIRNDAGDVMLKSSRGPNGYEVWKYIRDETGSVTREEYSLRGSLMKVTVYGEAKLRTEELYKGGKLFLKVFYDGDTRLREEVYLEGVLLRERTYE